MRTTEDFEFPPEELAVMRKARRLEIITLVYIVAAATSVWFVAGSSQAARAAFLEDVVSLAPSLAFLVAAQVRKIPASRDFPYGRGGAVSIAYLTAALALAAMGSFLVFEAVMTFVAGERTTIGGMSLFGRVVWAGWPTMGVLLMTGVGSMILGHLKLKLAPKIHDKVLFADAKMMRADWLSVLATVVGVGGVGLGLPWLDPLAGGVIGADILKDGVTNTKAAVADLTQRRPTKVDGSGPEDAPDMLKAYALSLAWVAEAEVRVRESGHCYFGEVFVRPEPDVDDLPVKVREAMAGARAMDWRWHDVTFIPVDDLELADEGLRDA